MSNSSDEYSSRQQAKEHRRLEEEEGFEIIRSKNVELIREIGGGPGYLLHAGQNKDLAVIVKVFNKNPTVRQQLESTVALSKELMHPNVLRIKGISPHHSPSHFIVYENGHSTNAEIPLATALRNDLARSITLGFKMIAEISAGISHLCTQGVWLRSMGVANFHILVDPEDRFFILIDAPQAQEVDTAAPQEPEDTALVVFNALLNKTFISTNRVLHKENIKRDPAIPDPKRHSFLTGNSAATSASSTQNIQGDELTVPPRREYVWRTMDHGRQALEDVSERLTVDLKFHLSRLTRSTRTDGLSAHRCPGYVREEITLTTTILDSAVVAHDTPSPLEECPVCHEVVGLDEAFLCICGDLTPGSRHTIKCRECKVWSHSNCVGNPRKFTCAFCFRSTTSIQNAKDMGRQSPHHPTDVEQLDLPPEEDVHAPPLTPPLHSHPLEDEGEGSTGSGPDSALDPPDDDRGWLAALEDEVRELEMDDRLLSPPTFAAVDPEELDSDSDDLDLYNDRS
ncbi:hypothetical protein B0H14DRAFT_3475783 [Mycena olivaceomarginata]|nr:hypothetical protein B0H14DRAFT_3475783 [Mycena olivaceomarginata]